MRDCNVRVFGVAFFLVALGASPKQADASDYEFGNFVTSQSAGNVTISGSMTWGAGDTAPSQTQTGSCPITDSNGNVYSYARNVTWTVDTVNRKLTFKFEQAGMPSGKYTYVVKVPIPGGTEQESATQDLEVE